MKKITAFADLTPDPRNANRGTVRGRGMLEHSLRSYGAGRSILADKNGVLIAGNKTAEVAAQLGLSVREIETDGHELVVVKRTDLDMTTDESAQMLALADNRVAEVDLSFDPALLKTLSAQVDLTPLWSADEFKQTIAEKERLSFLDADDAPLSLSSKPAAEEARIPLSIVLNTYEARRWRDYKESIDEKDDKKALLALLEAV